MVLISRLVSYDFKKALCEVDIGSESPFYQESLSGVASYVGIEYMAQSIAAYAGALALDKGEDVKIGFLLGSRKFQTFQTHFESGKTYQIEVEELYKEDSGLSVFECSIQLEEAMLAVAKVNVFLPDSVESFVKGNDE